MSATIHLTRARLRRLLASGAPVSAVVINPQAGPCPALIHRLEESIEGERWDTVWYEHDGTFPGPSAWAFIGDGNLALPAEDALTPRS